MGLTERSGPIWDVKVDWTVATRSGSYTANTSGTFDTLTDRIAVSGEVEQGVLEYMGFDALVRIRNLRDDPSFRGHPRGRSDPRGLSDPSPSTGERSRRIRLTVTAGSGRGLRAVAA